MATFLTGLFLRGRAYYLRIVLPKHHPLRPRYRNGRFVCVLGRCSYLQAVRIGTLKRAEVLYGFQHTQETPTLAESSEPLSAKSDQAVKKAIKLRDIFDRWAKAERRTADTLAACERALKLYEVTPACTQAPASETGSPRPVHRTQVLVLPAIGAR